MAAVAPIAMAPQKVTLNIGLRTPAPPVCAPAAPRTASATSEPADTTHGIRAMGEAMATSKGMAAPTLFLQLRELRDLSAFFRKRGLLASLFRDKGADIFCFLRAECHVRHFRMRLKQERGDLRSVEIWSFRYRRE